MAAQRLRVRQIRNVLKLHFENRLPQREIARVCGIGNGTLAEGLRRARKVGLVWPLPEDLTDEALKQQLYRSGSGASEVGKANPDLAAIHLELSRPGVTLQLVWVECRDIHHNGYGYSRFCELYQRFRTKLRPTMRQIHEPGKKTFVDYSGKKPTNVDRPESSRRWSFSWAFSAPAPASMRKRPALRASPIGSVRTSG